MDLVLGAPVPGRRRRLLIAVVIALGAHGSLWLWAARSAPPSGSLAARVRAEVAREPYFDLAEPSPPPPPPPEDKPKPKEPVRRPALPTESAKPPPPAQAAAIIAQQPDPSTPLDLTGETFVTGTGRAYAGGVTAATGTNTAAVHTRDVDPQSTPGAHAGAPDLSTSVLLEDQSWSCPWPHEADTAQIDEQTVVIRVVVTPDGSPESAEVVSDPGHGFAQAAAACAMRTRFTPAQDREGEPVRARSPPIRVRFTR